MKPLTESKGINSVTKKKNRIKRNNMKWDYGSLFDENPQESHNSNSKPKRKDHYYENVDNKQ